jgi:hypothetical protein
MDSPEVEVSIDRDAEIANLVCVACRGPQRTRAGG